MKYWSEKYFLVIFLVFFSACKKENRWDCIKSTGKIVKKERILAPFNKLHLSDNINIFIRQDSIQMVLVEAGENLLGKIKTEVRGDRLYVFNENKCDWVRSYDKKINVYLTMPRLEHVWNEGYGNIASENTLHLYDFWFHHYGNGDVTLEVIGRYLWLDLDHFGNFTITGKAEEMEGTMHNLGKLNTEGLICSKVIATNTNASDLYVRADSTLHATIESTGSIIYAGNPSVKFNLSGKGKLIKK
jgi:hypothetical protein